MAKEEATEKKEISSSDQHHFKKPLAPVKKSSSGAKKDHKFRMPLVNLKNKNVRKKMKPIIEKLSHGLIDIIENQSQDLLNSSPRVKYKRLIQFVKKNHLTEIASDKNIALLLKSERLVNYVATGTRIPYELAINVMIRTGFHSVNEFNNYIYDRQSTFIVLCGEQKNQNTPLVESTKRNGYFRENDSVNMELYFQRICNNKNIESSS
ncbi:uncharacterized protein LOC106658167 [Trichogramma pretiosum]|uniref:uncharacterized protein LOC106658167 n=1 Tax=Trichogramma pretiosum TaxID=7493 RepID=UPI0006C9DD55|nr:uncharacterized protein LOC106658167 [Trichogramma pretiosum]